MTCCPGTTPPRCDRDSAYITSTCSSAQRRAARLQPSHILYLFVGSETGGKAAAIAIYSDRNRQAERVDPQAWLADTLARIPDYKITKIDNLLPWRWNG